MENTRELIQEFVDCDVWAVVGYSEDSRKYGHIILNDLRRAGYQVYPVNKKGGEMDGMKVFESVSELPKE
ncbi:MAG TPA: CoA-binding protein, partial [Acidobacteriota bacterium]|nr:CoA-binding protein [Acidobacteriota bacterium]